MEYRFFDYESFILKQNEKRALKRTALSVGLSILVYFVSSFLMGLILFLPTNYLLGTVTTVEMYDVVYEGYTALCYLVPMVLAILPIAILTRIPFRVAVPMRRVPARVTIPSIMMILGCSIMGIIITSVLLTLFQSAGLGYDVPMPEVPQTTVGIVMYFITLSVLPAIFEELLFRGFMLQSLRRFGDWFAIIISSLIFALFHGNFTQLPNAFIMGIAIAFVTVRTGSMIPGMILHFINNFVASAISVFLVANVTETVEIIVNLIYIGSYFLLGILGLVIIISTQPSFFNLKKPDSPLTRGERTKAFFLQPVALVGMLLMFGYCFVFFAQL